MTGTVLQRASRTDRPRSSGDPLDLSTEPSVPKPRWQIEIVESGGRLTLADRKLFNVLLALSWEKLADPGAELPTFRAPAAALRRAIGEEGENGNARLRESFNRLMSTICVYPHLSGGEWKEGGSPLLSFRALPKGSGEAEWEFPAKLRPVLAEPGAWARIHLAICAQFASKYGLLLYELLSVRVNLREPKWEVSVEGFRQLLGVGSKLTNFAHFERYALEPAVEEVNALSGFTVSYETKRSAGKGRRVERLKFTITKKDLGALVDVARSMDYVREPVGRAAIPLRDADTVDMEDGKTDRERGASTPDSPEGLMARVARKTLTDLAAAYPSIDLEAELREWASWAAAQHKPCRNPSMAFRGFVARKAEQVGAVSLPAPAAVRRALMSAGEERALTWLQGQSYDVRKVWFERAVAKGATVGSAPTAPSNLGQWIGFVVAEINAEIAAR